MTLTKTKADLCNVLRYAQELLSINDRVILDLARHSLGHFLEHQVIVLEGVSANVDPETWLRLRRLREAAPPGPDPIFDGWIQPEAHPSPDRAPVLLGERLLTLPIEDVSDLIEAGLLSDPGDALRPLDADEPWPDRMDVILRLAELPEFGALWQDHIDGPWAKWAEIERPRRRSIDFYNKIYQIHQRLIMAEEAPVELVFGVGLARWRIGQERINRPLIEQLVELELDGDGTLFLRPRSTPPRLVLAAFRDLEVAGAKSLQRELGQQFERQVEDPDIGFSPFDPATFESLLRSCVARLSASGVYWPDEAGAADRSPPETTGTLRISDTWVIYVRQRNDDFRRDDIERLIRQVEQIEDAASIPPAGRRMVEPPSDRRSQDEGLIDLSGVHLTLPDAARAAPGEPRRAPGGEAWPDGAAIGLFPLPHNDEQLEIMQRLEGDGTDGVVVQGPPGTGKTHTIANIICHYLATQRRVLVTARTPEALTALQEKIPEGIRDLAIAVIHNDREGARQLQQAVRLLAEEARQINSRAVGEDVLARQARLAVLYREMEEIDRELYSHAERNLAVVAHGGKTILPMELSRHVRDERGRHGWLDDALDLSERCELRFGAAEIDEIRDLRRRIGADLACRCAELPDPSRLPDAARIVAAHEALGHVGKAEARVASGQVPLMSQEVAIEDAVATRAWLLDFAAFLAEADAEPWLRDGYLVLTGHRRLDPRVAAALRETLEKWVRLHHDGTAFVLRAIDTGPIEPDDPALGAALARLAEGQEPVGLLQGWWGRLRGDRTEDRIAAVTLDGRAPSGAEEWRLVLACRDWRRDAAAFMTLWPNTARLLGAPGHVPANAEARHELMRLGPLVERMLAFADQSGRCRERLKALFPYGLDPDDAVVHGRCTPAIEALTANLGTAEASSAQALRTGLLAMAESGDRLFHTMLREMAATLGRPQLEPRRLVELWGRVCTEAERLAALRPALERLDALVERVAASGAPRWAARLRSAEPGNTDAWTPTYWQESWDWARAAGFIRSLDSRARIEEITAARAAREQEQRRLFAELVRLRTFLGLKQALTPQVEQALAKFGTAIANLGKGTGKTSGRRRRIVRDAALDAAQAVPCWILPEWRVAEQLPAELGVFDLVIIDEASQSDITALPAILRGKKVLIVGDDKQVSPTAVGIEDRKVIQLRDTYLTGTPLRDYMDPETSLYDLGGMIFPGQTIMLREHFRCVEPIIRFSSRFYPRPLTPLRLPKATERLDPPLIDIYVPHGSRYRKELNPAEAEVICAEIAQLVADPGFGTRSIGVISLIGTAQAKLIYDRLTAELGAEVMERHRIMCGNAATFQGQERDVVFLSMVAAKGDAVAATARRFEQRFNVAMSRARDRVYLVRSVAASDLKPEDLKFRLIEHFMRPMDGGNVEAGDDILALCESAFEREFGRRMLERGYRLRPQVPVGDYRVDFVIEGHGDRRLAVELDGDGYHGPQRWADDLRRQKALERLGWTFWRCWGSSWIADTEGCLAELERRLQALGIEPIGAVPVQAIYTRHITVDPPPAPDIPDFEAEPAATAEPVVDGEIKDDGSREAGATEDGATRGALPGDAGPPAASPPVALPPDAGPDRGAPPPVRRRGRPRKSAAAPAAGAGPGGGWRVEEPGGTVFAGMIASRDPSAAVPEAVELAVPAPDTPRPDLVLTPPEPPKVPVQVKLGLRPGQKRRSEPSPARDPGPQHSGLDAYAGAAAEIGDLVVIRYHDQPDKALRVRLSRQENRPDAGIVSIHGPLGGALLGASVDDEIEVRIGEGTRKAVVERIEKAGESRASA